MSFIRGQRIIKCLSLTGNVFARSFHVAKPSRVQTSLFQLNKTFSNFKPNRVFNRYDENAEENIKIQNDKYDQHDLIKEALRDDQIKSIQDIENLKIKVLKSGNYIKDVNFNTNFMGICSEQKNLHAGKLLFNHVSSKEGNLNVSFVGKFLKLCYNCREICEEEDFKNIEYICTNILEEYEFLDCNSCECLTVGLSITNKWKDIPRIFDMCRNSALPTLKMYTAYIIAALRNGDVDLAWKIMGDSMDEGRKPSLEVYREFLKEQSITRLEQIFSWLEKYNEHLQIELAYDIINCQESNLKDINAGLTSVSPEGKCRKCLQNLKGVKVTQEEFDYLKQSFLNPVLVGKDVFLKTKPGELQRYFNFLEDIGDIDVVVDGLNVAYGTNKPGGRAHAEMLRTVLEHFIENNKKVLIIGKKHMLNWPSEHINYIKRNSKLFLTENVSSDDPFFLHAAMYSGLGTKFVSKDQMRGHKFLLKDEKLKNIFSKWQQQHQLYVKYVTDDGRVYFHKPPPYLMETHLTEDGSSWHLPILEDTPGAGPLQQLYNTTWLCVSKVNNSE